MGRTLAEDPTQQYRFKISIEGITGIGFQKASGLESEIEVTEYREGGYNRMRKIPGQEKTGTVTLERGSFKDKHLFTWFKQVLTQENFRKTITITEQDHLGRDMRTWTLFEAWASKVAAPELDASSSDVAVESVEIQFEELA